MKMMLGFIIFFIGSVNFLADARDVKYKTLKVPYQDECIAYTEKYAVKERAAKKLASPGANRAIADCVKEKNCFYNMKRLDDDFVLEGRVPKEPFYFRVKLNYECTKIEVQIKHKTKEQLQAPCIDLLKGLKDANEPTKAHAIECFKTPTGEACNTGTYPNGNFSIAISDKGTPFSWSSPTQVICFFELDWACTHVDYRTLEVPSVLN